MLDPVAVSRFVASASSPVAGRFLDLGLQGQPYRLFGPEDMAELLDRLPVPDGVAYLLPGVFSLPAGPDVQIVRVRCDGYGLLVVSSLVAMLGMRDPPPDARLLATYGGYSVAQWNSVRFLRVQSDVPGTMSRLHHHPWWGVSPEGLAESGVFWRPAGWSPVPFGSDLHRSVSRLLPPRASAAVSRPVRLPLRVLRPLQCFWIGSLLRRDAAFWGLSYVPDPRWYAWFARLTGVRRDVQLAALGALASVDAPDASFASAVVAALGQDP